MNSGIFLPIESVNFMTNSQNQTQTAKTNVLSAIDQKVADGKKTEAQAQPVMQAPVQGPSNDKPVAQQGATVAPAAQQGDTAAPAKS
jgi:hypothetical protein